MDIEVEIMWSRVVGSRTAEVQRSKVSSLLLMLSASWVRLLRLQVLGSTVLLGYF
jgi:hypothetical protein